MQDAEQAGVIGLDLVGFYYDPERAERHRLLLIEREAERVANLRMNRRLARQERLFGPRAQVPGGWTVGVYEDPNEGRRWWR